MENNVIDTVTSSSQVSRQVMGLLHRFRRVEQPAPTPEGGRDDDRSCVTCFERRRSQIEAFIQEGQPIHFVIPAFPAKSPNTKKVLGPLPDLGEQLALGFLQSLCDYIGHFYIPGAYVTICSDGHVFGEVVGVTDPAITEYRRHLELMIDSSQFDRINLFGLDDAFGERDYPKLRAHLDNDYADTVDTLRERIRADRDAQALFNGIHRFMFEDAVGVADGTVSKTKLRGSAKRSAYQTILRSNAWSRVVKENFPSAVRLSIHPQAHHSEKFGMHLMKTRDQWLTPWHGVVLDDGVTQSLVKRWEAEQRNATLVFRNGVPSHFIAPTI